MKTTSAITLQECHITDRRKETIEKGDIAPEARQHGAAQEDVTADSRRNLIVDMVDATALADPKVDRKDDMVVREFDMVDISPIPQGVDMVDIDWEVGQILEIMTEADHRHILERGMTQITQYPMSQMAHIIAAAGVQNLAPYQRGTQITSAPDHVRIQRSLHRIPPMLPPLQWRP